MKLKISKKIAKKNNANTEKLKLWKYSSTKAKLTWLESGYIFGKLKKFKRTS